MKHKNNIFSMVQLLSYVSIIFVLISTGCQTKNSNESRLNTTIHEATFMNNIDQVKAHIAAGSDLNEKDEWGSTPLNIAATFNKIEVAKLLIDAGADLSEATPDGTTALHTAVFLCRTEIVDFLLEHHANAELKNSFGATPLLSVQAPFEQMKPIYEQMNRDMGVLGLKLDYDFLESEREVIANKLISYQNSNR